MAQRYPFSLIFTTLIMVSKRGGPGGHLPDVFRTAGATAAWLGAAYHGAHLLRFNCSLPWDGRTTYSSIVRVSEVLFSELHITRRSDSIMSQLHEYPKGFYFLA